MSAFVVNSTHVSAIVRWACRANVTVYSGNPTRSLAISGREQEIAQILHNENVKSVNFRYHEVETPDHIVYDAFAASLNAVEVIKACHCLAYQSCEHEGWGSSFAKSIVDAIVAAATRELPGYDKAAWEVRPKQEVPAGTSKTERCAP